jgi:hypothetical protein
MGDFFMCVAKPKARGARQVTPSGVVYYDDTPEGNAAQAEDMAKEMGPGAGESAHPGDAEIPPTAPPPDTKDCTTYTDAMWDTSCSKYFKFSQMKMKPSAQNGLTAAQVACNWQKLCQNILDPIVAGGLKININSAFRSEAFNASLGNSSKTSDHMTGCAADLSMGSPEGNKQLFKWIGKNLNPAFSQVIFEGKWVHVAYKGRSPESVCVLVTRSGAAPYANGGGRPGSKLDPDLKWA